MPSPPRPPPPPPSPGGGHAEKMPANRTNNNNPDSSSSLDYLADAEAIVQNSPIISPRQSITITNNSGSGKNTAPQYYSPKSPRNRVPPPPPPPRTSAAYQRTSSHGSAASSSSNNVSSSRRAAASSSVAVPASPKSPRPPPPPPLTVNRNPTVPIQQQQQQLQQASESFQSSCPSFGFNDIDDEPLSQQRENNIKSSDQNRSQEQQQQQLASSSWREQSYHNNNNNSVDSFQSYTGSSSSNSRQYPRRNSSQRSSIQQEQEQRKHANSRRLSHGSVKKSNHLDNDGGEEDWDGETQKERLDSCKPIPTAQHDANNTNNNNSSSTSRNKCTSILKSLLCIFPKIQPLPPQTFITLFLFNIIPPICYIVLFTQMGLGEDIYFVISDKFGEHAYILALGLFGFVVGLYMLDAECWSGKLAKGVLKVCIMVIVLGVVLLTLCIADQFPYGMVCLFAIFQPLWLLGVKLVCYKELDSRVFVSWLSGPLFLTSLCTGVAWMVWVFSNPENQWNLLVRMELAEQSGCIPNYEEYPNCRSGGMNSTQEETCFSIENGVLEFPEGCDQSCTGVYNDCTSHFILWVGPVLVGMTMFFLSFFCTFLRTEGTKEKDIFNFGKLWLFILFAIWVTTSLSGIASGVTSALAALTLASFVASAVFIAVSFDRDERRENTAAVFKRLRDKYGENLDIARGMFVVTCAPIILIYCCFSITNQLIRKTRIFPCSHPVRDSNDMFTARTRRQIDQMKTWDRARVYTFAVYWGIFFMVMQVLVAKLTVVFLSWLIEQTASFGLGAVTALLVVVGVTMFLLPPVPGVPVYLTLGIVLPAQGHKTLGWVGSIAYSIAIGLLLKLFSSALQQKMIGENLSRYVRVRQFVGVNSILMKAMRLVLSQNGLSVPKVAILIG